MALPPLAPFPPANIRLALGPEEWEACLDAWLTLSELTLRLSKDNFQQAAKDDGGLPIFLTSFYRQLQGASEDASMRHAKVLSLRKVCFALMKRTVVELDVYSEELLGWDFLACFCRSHLKSPSLRELMNTLWARRSTALSPILQKRKGTLIGSLESTTADHDQDSLLQLAALAYTSPDIGTFFMTGSDFLDALISAYGKRNDEQQRKSITSITSLGLESLLAVDNPNSSLLSDHLYSLKAQADKSPGIPSLLADIVTNTSTTLKLKRLASGKAPERLFKLLETLETYRTPSLARPKRHTRRKPSKGKNRQDPQDDSLHIHRLSLVTQIQDLFPDLGAGFILKALDEYHDDAEQVTAHLLDDSLPPHLANADRSEPAPTPSTAPAPHLTPHPTPPLAPQHEAFIPERRNVFDADELDPLTAKLHIGKANRSSGAGAEPPNSSSNKAAILSALAAFDSDDDERDDTYDVDDVGGTVDTAHPDGEPSGTARVATEGASSGSGGLSAETERKLYGVFKATPELFGRTFDVRRGQARAALKAETGLTDEALEGWAVMLRREPRRVRRLEAGAAEGGGFDGRQRELGSTAYREGTETEDSDVGTGREGPGGRGRGGGGRGRGQGRGGRGRGRGGGNVAGASSDPSTAAAQRRKEANKGSRANHNRRDQRAKKMARGGFSG